MEGIVVVSALTLAVFILEDASVWANYLPLCIVQDEQRKIVRPDG